EPTPTSWSDWAPNSGTAMSCMAPSALVMVIATTAPSATRRSGLTTSLIGPALPMNTIWPPVISVRRLNVTSAIGVPDSEPCARASWWTKPPAAASASASTNFLLFSRPWEVYRKPGAAEQGSLAIGTHDSGRRAGPSMTWVKPTSPQRFDVLDHPLAGRLVRQPAGGRAHVIDQVPGIAGG